MKQGSDEARHASSVVLSSVIVFHFTTERLSSDVTHLEAREQRLRCEDVGRANEERTACEYARPADPDARVLQIDFHLERLYQMQLLVDSLVELLLQQRYFQLLHTQQLPNCCPYFFIR